jgi:hypothetical protein
MSQTGDDQPIEGLQLTTWAVMPGGGDVLLNLATADGGTCGLVLPFDALSSLLMTLPRMLQAALEARSSDASLCVAQPLGRWRVEEVQGRPGLVLKLATPDGFEVAFAMDGGTTSSLGMALVTASRMKTADDARPLH